MKVRTTVLAVLLATVDESETVSSSSESVRPRAEFPKEDTATVYAIDRNLTSFLYQTTGNRGARVLF